MFETTTMPKIIAIDDWMVWGETVDGILVETCAEMWPEWLDYQCDPSDMTDGQYRLAVLQILQTKRPTWRSVADMERSITKRWNTSHGVVMSDDEITEDVLRIMDGIRELAIKQALPQSTLPPSKSEETVMAKITIRQNGKVYEGPDAFKRAARDEIGVWMPIKRSENCWVIERRTGMGMHDFETACHPKGGHRIYCKTKTAAQRHADHLNA